MPRPSSKRKTATAKKAEAEDTETPPNVPATTSPRRSSRRKRSAEADNHETDKKIVATKRRKRAVKAEPEKETRAPAPSRRTKKHTEEATSDHDAHSDWKEMDPVIATDSSRTKPKAKPNKKKKSDTTQAAAAAEQEDISSHSASEEVLDDLLEPLKTKKKTPPTSSTKKRKAKSDETSSPGSDSKKKSKKERGPLAQRTCPKCQRVFTSIFGKKYHCSNRVCEQKAEDKTKGGISKEPMARLEPGTEFVTPWGIVRVVHDPKYNKNDDSTGKVELPEDAAEKFKYWKCVRTRLEAKRKEQYRVLTVHSLARRKRLSQLYQKEQQQQQQQQQLANNNDNNSQRNSKPGIDVWMAYHGNNVPFPGQSRIEEDAIYVDRNFSEIARASPDPHPMEPAECQPDRIVECILIPDRRKLFEFHGVKNDSGTYDYVQAQKENLRTDQSCPSTTKLFLQRRELTELYNPKGNRVSCSNCGRVFASVPGGKYHVKNQACYNQCKNSTNTDSNSTTSDKNSSPEGIMTQLDHRAERLVKRQNTPLIKSVTKKYNEPKPQIIKQVTSLPSATVKKEYTQKLKRQADGKFAPNPNKKPRQWKSQKKPELPYYPQFWLSLGFKVPPKIKHSGRVSAFNRKRQPKADYVPSMLRAENIGTVTDIYSTLEKMRDELGTYRDPVMGSYYPEVWRFLGFIKPTPWMQAKMQKKFSIAMGYAVAQEAESERIVEEEIKSPPRPPTPPEEFDPTPPPPLPNTQPVITDVNVLAGEVDSGRYPSTKRNNFTAEDGQHEDACYMCRDPRGILYCCDFCPRVNHMKCLRTRFIVKDPEPHDDFMCNFCIQTINWKRRRAEKRRLRRGEGGDEFQQNEDPAAEGQSAADFDDDSPEPGQEMEFVVKRARNMELVMELLKDSQQRLQQLVETSKINDFRRNQLMR